MTLPLLSQPGYAHGFLRTGLNAMDVQWKSIAYRACIPARQAYAQTIGSDGMELLIAVWAETYTAYLRQIPAVEIQSQTWVHQYYQDLRRSDRVRPRSTASI